MKLKDRILFKVSGMQTYIPVLSLRVPITGIHLLSGIEKSLPDASRAELRVKVPHLETFSLHVKPQMNQLIQMSNVVKIHSR